MATHFLYSTNPFIKYYIQREWRGDVHFVWCSEFFDSHRAPSYSSAASVPASSNPLDIYRDLVGAVRGGDRHNAKINDQRQKLVSRAAQWHADGEIDESARDEIVWLATNAALDVWRPLIYLIPRHLVLSRAKPVPAALRAGLGNEWTIEDLKGVEFEVMEV
jgi:hypothetical protein